MRVKSILPAYDILQLNAQQVTAYVIALLSYHKIPKTVRRRTMRWPKTRPATLEDRSIVISIKTRSETYRAKLPHHTVEHANHKNRHKKKKGITEEDYHEVWSFLFPAGIFHNFTEGEQKEDGFKDGNRNPIRICVGQRVNAKTANVVDKD